MLHALHETAVASVDLENVADLDVHGNVHYSASLERSRLGRALHRVALEARLGFGNSELDEHHGLDADELVTSILQRDLVVLLEPFC